MNDERGLEGIVIDSQRLVKRGYSAIIKNAGKAIAVITAVIAVLVSFTDISFLEAGGRELTASALMLLVASYIIFFSLVSAGRQLGRESEEYKSAEKSYSEVRERVTGSDLSALREFVSRWQIEELSARRSHLLLRYELTREEYLELERKKKLTRREKKILRKIKSEKPLPLTAAGLLADSTATVRERPMGKGTRTLCLLLRLIPTTLCALFTVSVMLGVRDNMTAASVIEALLRLSTLPIVALKGYTAGYEEVVSFDVELLSTRKRLLCAFLERKVNNS